MFITLSMVFVCYVLHEESNLSLIWKFSRESLKLVNLIFTTVVMAFLHGLYKGMLLKTIFLGANVEYLSTRHVAS